MTSKGWTRNEGQYADDFTPIEHRSEPLDLIGKDPDAQYEGMVASTAKAMTLIDGKLYKQEQFEEILRIKAQSIGISPEQLREEALQRLEEMKKLKMQEQQNRDK